MKPSVRVRAEPAGFSVWLLADDPMLVAQHRRQGEARACARVLAREGGCGGEAICRECGVDFAERERLLA